ncbi:Hypothetical predicted protein [Lynx pardinus]|uniref:Uncharacterized protein n=1 Tax=Lynx pardinus TaxID=191816 RepID=A0A485NWI7_LYNPA|nr:Hypothetical predicted protein [Lynx pardinus]
MLASDRSDSEDVANLYPPPLVSPLAGSPARLVSPPDEAPDQGQALPYDPKAPGARFWQAKLVSAPVLTHAKEDESRTDTFLLWNYGK